MENAVQTADDGLDKNRKILIAIVVAAVVALVATGGTAIGVGNYNAETERLCAAALEHGASATTDAKTTVTAAAKVLETAEGTTLPDGAGTSTSYADRPAVEARAGGAEYIAEVIKARDALAKFTIPATCSTRDQAASIPALTASTKTAIKTLDTRAQALSADFGAFQNEEIARIAAEVEAARVAAEAEAARVAAELEAARLAAEQAAAERASNYEDSDSGYSGGGESGSGGTSGGGHRGSSGTPGGGGGRVGPGGDAGGHCWTDNGVGGLMAC